MSAKPSEISSQTIPLLKSFLSGVTVMRAWGGGDPLGNSHSELHWIKNCSVQLRIDLCGACSGYLSVALINHPDRKHPEQGKVTFPA